MYTVQLFVHGGRRCGIDKLWEGNVVLNAHHGQAGLSIAVAVPVVERIHPGVSVLSSPVRGGGRRLRVILIHLAHQLQPLPASVKRKQGGIKPAQNQRKI